MLAADLGWDGQTILPATGATALPEPSAITTLSTSLDAGADQSLAEGEQTPARDLVAFAKSVAASGTRLYGAAWCPTCTAQKQLFEDGADFLPFIESTNPDRTLNQAGSDANITAFPTWVFPDNSRFVGILTLDEIATRSGVAIPTSANPSVAPVGDQTVLGGSPLHLGLDGYDPNGDALTFTVTSNNPSLVTPTVLSGNRSARVSVSGWGDMVFELFEGRVPRPAGRFIELADSGFYDAANNDPPITVHRVYRVWDDGIGDYSWSLFQFGDPLGTGRGGSTLGDFDDQFDPDIQHNNPGALSWAKGGDDTNDSQVFVTDVPMPQLDFNHSVFGQLTEGDSVRAAITATEVDAGDAPSIPINMDSVEIFQDTENAVVMLKAAEGASGEAEITVTATDTDGNQATQTFHVTVIPDPFNGGPYLQDIPAVSTTFDTPATFQLSAVDVENDPVRFAGLKMGSVDYTVSVDPNSGLVTVTPPTGFTGSFDVLVGVAPATTSDTDDMWDTQVVPVTVLPETPTDDPLVGFRLALEDSQGNPVSDIDVGSDFVLNVFVQDLRDTANGAFSAYLDVLYDSQFVGVDGPITRGSHYLETQSGTATPGLLDEVGGIEMTPLDGGEYLLFSVQMQATRAGSVDFSSDPADESVHETTLHGYGWNVDFDKISFGTTSLTVNVAFGANDDLFNVDEDSGGTTLDVLANDEVFPGSPGTLLVTQTGATSGGGTVQITGDGTTIAYTPAGNFFGVDTFTYTVDDGTGTDQATVSVQVMPINDDPTAVDDQFDVMEDTTTNLNVLPNDLITPDVGESLTVSGVATPSAGGTVSVSADGGHVIYTPAHDFFGDETFTYTISDGHEGSSTATATVHVAQTNDPPSAHDDRVFLVEDSQDNPIDVLANDDTAGDVDETLKIVGVSTPEHGGTVSIAAGDQSLVYSPEADFFGTERFIYTISDGNGGKAEASVLVTVQGINDPPTANDDSYTVVKDSSEQHFAVLDNDSSQPDGNETLTLSAVGTTTAGGTVAVSDDGLDLVYTPPAGFTGPDSFTYTIQDEGEATADATVSVDVQEYIPSDLSGYVYIDANDNGVKDSLEVAIGGVHVTLVGTDMFGADVLTETTTDASGFYAFAGLAPGDYAIEETQPEQLLDGVETVGTQGGTAGDDQISIPLQQDTNGQNNNFGERGRQAESVSLYDFFASTPRDSVLAIAGDEPSQQWFVIEGGWTRATALDVQIDDSLDTASLDVTDDTATQFHATLELNNPRQVQVLDEYPSSSLLRIVGSPHDLFPEADCECAPAEAEANVPTSTGDAGAEGEPLSLSAPAPMVETVAQGLSASGPVAVAPSDVARLTALPIDLVSPGMPTQPSQTALSDATAQPVTLANTADVDALMTGTDGQDEPVWRTEDRVPTPAGTADDFSETVDLLMAGLFASSLR